MRGRCEPIDAVRAPLRFPWRMTTVEAAVIGFLKHSRYPALNTAAAVVFGTLGTVMLGLLADEAWDAHVLRDRGVVVQGTVVSVPGQVGVTWPGIEPESMFLEGGGNAEQWYSVGDAVSVVLDPHDPTRARLVGAERSAEAVAWQLGLAAVVLFLAGGYAKWARWLAVTARAQQPPPRGRHRARGRA